MATENMTSLLEPSLLFCSMLTGLRLEVLKVWCQSFRIWHFHGNGRLYPVNTHSLMHRESFPKVSLLFFSFQKDLPSTLSVFWLFLIATHQRQIDKSTHLPCWKLVIKCLQSIKQCHLPCFKNMLIVHKLSMLACKEFIMTIFNHTNNYLEVS